MGQIAEFRGNFAGGLCNLVQLLLGLRRETWQILLELRDADLQECHPLTQIVMQLPRNTSTFLLLCLNQSAAYTGENFFRAFPLGNIEYVGDKELRLAIAIANYG